MSYNKNFYREPAFWLSVCAVAVGLMSEAIETEQATEDANHASHQHDAEDIFGSWGTGLDAHCQ